LGLLALVAAVGGSWAGVLLLVLVALALPVVIGLHLRLRRPRRQAIASDRPLTLRTPGQVGLAVFVVASGGALTVVVVSLLAAAAVSSLVGDGSVLVRALLVVCVLGPCMSLGMKCGRWWAFVGAAGIVPLLGFAMLAAGSISTSDVEFLLVAMLTTAFALALGSLQSQWRAQSLRADSGAKPVLSQAAAETTQIKRRSAASH
jgi:hypothetical protein